MVPRKIFKINSGCMDAIKLSFSLNVIGWCAAQASKAVQSQLYEISQKFHVMQEQIHEVKHKKARMAID